AVGHVLDHRSLIMLRLLLAQPTVSCTIWAFLPAKPDGLVDQLRLYRYGRHINSSQGASPVENGSRTICGAVRGIGVLNKHENFNRPNVIKTADNVSIINIRPINREVKA
ncbi:hypothetical protein L9F63_003883, partial [Diploptera punctata]